MRDVTDSLCFCKRGGGFEEILPFIMMAGKPDKSDAIARSTYPVWLEWSPNFPPTAEDIAKSSKTPQQQTLENYQSLPIHQFSNFKITRLAVAGRIAGGEVIFAKVFGGCMWGMIPSDEPKPET